MPDAIRQVLGEGILLDWYSWPLLVAGLIALASMTALFYIARTRDDEPTLLKTISAVATALVIPAVLARLNGGFAAAVEMKDSLGLIAYVSMFGVAVSVFSLLFYILFGRPPRTSTDSTPWPMPNPTASGWAGSGQPIYPASGDSYGPGSGGANWTPGGFGQSQGAQDPTLIQKVSSSNLGEADISKTQIIDLNAKPRGLGFIAVVSGSHAGRVFSIQSQNSDDVTRIGRIETDNDIALDDGSVSKQHASIRFDGTGFSIADMDSENGTLVNGTRIIERRQLASNDRITLGRTRLAFLAIGGDSEV